MSSRSGRVTFKTSIIDTLFEKSKEYLQNREEKGIRIREERIEEKLRKLDSMVDENYLIVDEEDD